MKTEGCDQDGSWMRSGGFTGRKWSRRNKMTLGEWKQNSIGSNLCDVSWRSTGC